MRIAVFALALVVCVLTNIGCSASHHTSTFLPADAPSVVPARGGSRNLIDRTYRADDASGVIDLQWGERRGQLSGVVQLLTFPGGDGRARLYTGPGARGGWAFSFTGTRSGRRMLLNVNEGSGTTTWRGTFAGALLTLTVPSEEMVVNTIRPHVSLPSFRDFNQVMTLRVGPGSTTVS